MTTKLINPGYSDLINAIHALMKADVNWLFLNWEPFHPFIDQSAQTVDPEWFDEGKMQRLVEHGLNAKQLSQCLIESE